MLTLITGKPGSFKTAKTASLAMAYIKEGRNVYTNIDEFDYDGVQKPPSLK
jgi:zona occludens toxin